MGMEEGEVGARSLPAIKGRKRSLGAMEEEEPAGARSCPAMSRKQAEGEPRSWPAARRSPRLKRMKELEGKSEAFRMLKLKRELKDLTDRRREEQRSRRRHLNVTFGIDGGKSLPSEDEAGEEERNKVTQPPLTEQIAKRSRKEEVPQPLIEYYILNSPFNPEYSEYDLRKRSQMFRNFYAVEKAIIGKTWEYQQAIIKQFRTKGYAEDYSEVEDDEEEKEN